jgi:uncharacterized membrane protein
MKAQFGPIQLFVIGFPENNFSGEIMDELKRLREDKMIRLVGARMLMKDEDGEMSDIEYSDFSEDEKERLGAAIGALIGFGEAGEEGANEGASIGAAKVAEKDFGLSQDDIDEILEDIPKNSSVGILIIEHLWAKKLKEKIRNAGGILMAQGMLSPELMIKIGRLIAEEK